MRNHNITFSWRIGKHYENTPMQYTTIFHNCKNVHFQMKIFNIFLIFVQNIDRGYTLEPPHRGGSNALVICNHGPPTPGAGRGIAVEMSGVFTFALSPQCGGNIRDLCYIGKNGGVMKT